MSSDDTRSDDLRRINNQLATIIENQARFDENMTRMQEAVAGMIQVARIHDGQIDRNSEQIKEIAASVKDQGAQIEELRESVKQTTDNLNALIRIVEGHLSNHP